MVVEMARMTRAEHNAREELERIERNRLFVESYPERLLNLVYEYGTTDWERFRVVKFADHFHLTADDGVCVYDFMLPIKLTEYSASVDHSLGNAEYELASYNREVAEMVRLEKVRIDARRKVEELFTEEERIVLGLK